LKKEEERLPAIRIISLIYLVNAVLFFFSLLIFYSRILVFGQPAGQVLSALINASLLVVWFYLFLRFPRLKKDAFWVALAVHLFFVLNGIAMLLEHSGGPIRPPLHIVGMFGTSEYSLQQAVVIATNVLLNFLILFYLVVKKDLFLRAKFNT
jgi:hypothetical protein